MSTKIRLTKSLVDAWLWGFKTDDGYEKFLQTLNREKTPPTDAMLNGQNFENLVNAQLDGEVLDESHKWYKPASQMARYLRGSQKQVTLFREIAVDGQDYLIHGVLDFLRAGVVYDCKFTKNYHLNKYLFTETAQTGFYLYLVPEARSMEYLISDGSYIYREVYPRDIVPPIEPLIRNFIKFCKQQGLYNILCEKWRVNK